MHVTTHMVLRKLSGCVPPMEPRKTKCFTPADMAASIWFLAPVQSTSSGSPLGGHLNCGRPGCFRKSFFTKILRMEEKRI